MQHSSTILFITENSPSSLKEFKDLQIWHGKILLRSNYLNYSTVKYTLIEHSDTYLLLLENGTGDNLQYFSQHIDLLY